MTNSDPTPNKDPIGEFASAARKIEALKAEVIAALGRNSVEGEVPAEIAVAEASRIIVSTLTEMAGFLHGEETRQIVAGTDEEAGAPLSSETASEESRRYVPSPAMIPRRRPDLPEVERDVSLSYEELDTRIDTYLANSPGEDVRLPVVIRAILGQSRIDGPGYNYIQRRLETDIAVTRIGAKRYRILPGRERGALLGFPQLELWGEEAEFEPQRLLRAEEDTLTPEATEPVAVTEESGDDNGEDDEDSETMSDEELIGLVARFMGRRPYFTGDDLRQHLLKNEAVPPEEIAGNKIHAFIEEFMMYVDEYYFDKGDEVIWTDSTIDPDAVRAAMGGKSPKVKTYVLGFKPRPVVEVEAPPVQKPDVQTKKQQAVAEEAEKPAETSAAVEETRGQHERGVTPEQIQTVVDIVASVGDAMRWDSLLELLTDPDDLNLSREEAVEWINAAISDGKLFRKSIRGRKGVSLQPREKQKPEQPVVDTHSIEYIEQEVEKYARVVDYVMNSLTGLKELTMGLRYDRLWRRAGMEEEMTFDEFKDLVRRMEDDGFVSVPTNAKLSSGKSRSQIIRGSKVMFPNPDVRRQWKTYRKRMLSDARDKALDRLIK